MLFATYGYRITALLLVVTGLLLTQPKEADARLSLTWKKPPKTLVRGRHFVWQGTVQGLPASLLKRGVAISFLLMQSQRTIRLGQVPVNPKGEFVLEGVVSYQLSPQKYSLDVRILVPQRAPARANRSARGTRNGKGRTGRSLGRQGKGKVNKLKRGGPAKGRLAPDLKGSKDNNNYENLPFQRKPAPQPGAGDQAKKNPAGSQAPNGKSGDQPGLSGNKLSKKPGSSGAGKAPGSGKVPVLLQVKKRSQKLSRTLQRGWKTTQQKKPARRNTLGRSSFKAPSFLLPPIQPESRQNKGAKQNRKGSPSARRGSPGLNPRRGQSPSANKPGVRPKNPLLGQSKIPGNPKKSYEQGKQGSSLDRKSSQAKRAPVGRSSKQGERRSERSDFQTRSYPNLPGGAQGEDSYARRNERGNGLGSQRLSRGQGAIRRQNPERFEPSLDGAEPPAAARKRRPDAPPTMVPPIRPSLSRRRRRRSRKPVNPHKDSLIWNRSQSSKLDLNTDMGNTYLRQVFEPYIPHLQRISVFSRVRSNFLVDQVESNKRRIRVGGHREEGRSYFVGRIRVVLFRGRWTPIPSVSPEARILWYRTKPRVKLVFARDKGDLMYVRARRWKTSVTYLEFGTDGDRQYFGGKVPKNIRASFYPRYLRPYVPYRVRRVALRHMRRFGVHRGMPLHKVLRKVVPYLRSFVARKLKPEERRGNPFATLWRSRVGVCRHRSMLFVMAMQSLGFPARMIANQAHAFTEIQYPNGRWRQIDLGGGEIPHWMGKWQGDKYKKPKDPFPKPPPNPTRRRNLPTTPNPPPHGADPDSNQVPGVRVPGRRRNRRGDGPGQRMKLVPGKPPKKFKRRKKKRKPYIPHTRF